MTMSTYGDFESMLFTHFVPDHTWNLQFCLGGEWGDPRWGGGQL